MIWGCYCMHTYMYIYKVYVYLHLHQWHSIHILVRLLIRRFRSVTVGKKRNRILVLRICTHSTFSSHSNSGHALPLYTPPIQPHVERILLETHITVHQVWRNLFITMHILFNATLAELSKSCLRKKTGFLQVLTVCHSISNCGLRCRHSTLIFFKGFVTSCGSVSSFWLPVSQTHELCQHTLLSPRSHACPSNHSHLTTWRTCCLPSSEVL